MSAVSARSCSRSRALRSLSTKETKRSSTEGSTSWTQRGGIPARVRNSPTSAASGALRPQHHAQPGADAHHLFHRVPVREHVGGAAQVGHLHLDHRPPEGLALDDGGRALGDELALVDEAQAVAELGFVHVVGGDHDGRALVGEAPDQPPEVSPRDGVDARRGLVEEDEARRMDEGAGEGEALAVAAGQRARELALAPREVGELDHPRHAGGPLGSRHLVDAGVEGQVLHHGQVVVEGELLGHVPDHGLDALGVAGEVDAEHGAPALARLEDAAQHAEGGGLPRPVGPEEAVELTGADLEIQVVDGDALAESAGEVPRLDRVRLIRHRRRRAVRA